MKKLITIGIALAMLATMILPVAAMAATTGVVSVTVGTSDIAMTLSPDTWAITSISQGASVDSFNSDYAGHFTLNNTGNVAQNFWINGTDAVGSGLTWELVTTAPSGQEYNLGFSHASGGGSSYTEGAYTLFDETATTYALATDVVSGTSSYFDLQLTVAADTTVTKVMEATITITAILTP
jgi:hypothetical protein